MASAVGGILELCCELCFESGAKCGSARCACACMEASSEFNMKNIIIFKSGAS